MKIGVLTSSRADYGIYKSLLQDLSQDAFFDLTVVAFGMHLMPKFGLSIKEIRDDAYGATIEVTDLLESDDTASIVQSYARVCEAFSSFYEEHTYDLVIVLGDRFEMNAAVQAGIPFNIKYAHIHAGEKTLGAIDNIYRHQISVASSLLFTSTEEYKVEAQKYAPEGSKVWNVGALSLDTLKDIVFDEELSFKQTFDIPDVPYVLITFHPETVQAQKNQGYAKEMYESLNQIGQDIHLVITMPNADTAASAFRLKLEQLKKELPKKVSLIENFGKRHYFNAMHYANYLLGNTSSGIVEAASFGKYVINVGDRQKGRSQSANILNCNFEATEIIKSASLANNMGNYKGDNVYFREHVSQQIIEKIKQYFEKL